MIQSWRDRQTERFAAGLHVKAFSGFASQAERRLAILNAATSLDDLAALPSNRLEALKGDRVGQFSIRINQQWRVCFVWLPGDPGPAEVEIVDYH
ncbi:MAG: type II toxin-antitoxin system RelE/ParE family toxin [Hyphomonadaceae bacterium]|jgi:proteic killer suppression protein|nr:type II toxin-antitoxin system RelE/ParE family toxin [Hyphomonadaceae bacterium]